MQELPTKGKTPVGNDYVPADQYIPTNQVYTQGKWTEITAGISNVACLQENNEIKSNNIDFTLAEGPLTKITTSRGLSVVVDTAGMVMTPGGPAKIADLELGGLVASAAAVPPTQSKDMGDELVKLLAYCYVYGYWEYDKMVVNIPTPQPRARKEFLSLVQYFNDFSLGDDKFDEFYLVRGKESPIAKLCDFYGIVHDRLPYFVWDLNDRDLHTFLSIYYNSATEYIISGYKVFIDKRIQPEQIWEMQLLISKIGVVARRGRAAKTIKTKHRLLVINKRDVQYLAETLKPIDKAEDFAAAFSRTKNKSIWRRNNDVWWDIVKTVEGDGFGEYLDSNGAFIVNNLLVTTSA